MGQVKALVLGGTGDAHRLCLRLQAAGVDFVHSRAGIISGAPLPYPHRDGGFGGVEGLRDYLAGADFTHLICASHPFAARIAASARQAAQALDLPLIRFERPPWPRPKGADWRLFGGVQELARALPCGARVFLTLGRKQLAAFEGRRDLWFLWRVIEPSGAALNGLEIVARGPFDEAAELALMRQHKIDILASKQSGGAATFGKIAAAARLGVPVYMLKRPDLGFARQTHDAQHVLTWLRQPHGPQ